MTPAEEQRSAALKRANLIRQERAAVKRDMKAGRVSLAKALELECCQSAKIFDLLLCVPLVGPVKASRRLARIPVNPNRRVDALTSRERSTLAEACSAVGLGGMP